MNDPSFEQMKSVIRDVLKGLGVPAADHVALDITIALKAQNYGQLTDIGGVNEYQRSTE